MTLILGIEDPANNRAIISADSGIWTGDRHDVERRPKVWRVGPWVIAACGQQDLVLRLALIAPSDVPPDAPQPLVLGALLRWSEEVLEAQSRYLSLSKAVESERKSDVPGVLIAHGARIWEVSGGTVCTVERGYAAVGSPAEYALGAFEALRDDWALDFGGGKKLEPVMALHDVNEVVCALSMRVLRPFRWAATDGTEGTWR